MTTDRERWQKLDSGDRFPDRSDYVRPLALLLVRAIRSTPIRSLHLTWAFIAAGAAAGVLIGAGTPTSLAVAAVLLQIKNLLDAMDGSLARAQNRPSQTGRFLDSVGDAFVHAVVFAGIAWAAAPRLGHAVVWPLALAALVSALLQCSYYSFHTVAWRTLRRGNIVSRIDERSRPRDGGFFLVVLHRLYLAIYGWQDRWVQARVGRALGDPGAVRTPAGLARMADGPLFARSHLTRVSMLGLGVQLLVLTLAAGAAAAIGSSVPLAAALAVFLVAGNAYLVLDLVSIRRSALRTRGAGPAKAG